MLISLVEFQSVNILRMVAFTEIFLMPFVIIMIFLGKAGLLTPLIYYNFLTLRYASRRNPYTRNMFHEIRVHLEATANKPSFPAFLKGPVQNGIALAAFLFGSLVLHVHCETFLFLANPLEEPKPCRTKRACTPTRITVDAPALHIAVDFHSIINVHTCVPSFLSCPASDLISDPKRDEVEVEHHATKSVADEEEKGGDPEFIKNQQQKSSNLDEQLKEYIAEWRKQRSKEEDDLKRLKEKQAKRKVARADEEKRLALKKKEEEERRVREAEEKKQREIDEKRKRLEEAERKRQAMMQSMKNQAQKGPNFTITKKDNTFNLSNAQIERSKTKEQLEEEKKISLSFRIKPLELDGLNSIKLKNKARELWDAIVKLETEKYDLEERMKRQDYDLKELKERQKQQLRHKAQKKGLDPEALTGKYPPMIQVASKYERRVDTRSYSDKKKLFEGGFNTLSSETVEKLWKTKYENFNKRSKELNSLTNVKEPSCPSGSVSDLARRRVTPKPLRRRKVAREPLTTTFWRSLPSSLNLRRKQLRRKKRKKKKRKRRKKRKRKKRRRRKRNKRLESELICTKHENANNIKTQLFNLCRRRHHRCCSWRGSCGKRAIVALTRTHSVNTGREEGTIFDQCAPGAESKLEEEVLAEERTEASNRTACASQHHYFFRYVNSAGALGHLGFASSAED
ncbi:Hypothetical predicted protein [Cloeon dipterum]|uniref:Troponin T n=1 Tax=Cloeon dipterum TaxID=197152 RepID=A0A8S1C3C5_9INSE|nr:Hypothetical predicted protein [Cloeon dipterum]